MTQPLVSIVIPTRNRSGTVRSCLESLLAQSYPAYETIVVDDASTDDTQAMLAEFGHSHADFALTVLKNEPQLGANPSRNRGIKISRGALVAFADDDCVVDPGWVAGLVAAFTSERIGAVTGLVDEPPAKNIYDLALRGTHNVYGKMHATRLIGCNMCVRRELLDGKLDEDRAAVAGDPSVLGRGDEEDLFLKLKADGHEVRMALEARVLHVHYHTRRSFFRQAWKSGRSTAKLGYKYHLAPRPELLCLAAGYGFALASYVNPLSAVASVLCFGAFGASTLVYNEIWRKRKSVLDAIRVAPILLVYYHLRTLGYGLQYARFLLGLDRIERVRLGRAGR